MGNNQPIYRSGQKLTNKQSFKRFSWHICDHIYTQGFSSSLPFSSPSEVDTRPPFFRCTLYVTHTNISQLQWLKGKIKYLEMIPPAKLRNPPKIWCHYFYEIPQYTSGT